MLSTYELTHELSVLKTPHRHKHGVSPQGDFKVHQLSNSK